MTNQAKKLFVRLWKAEHKATTLSHKLNSDLDVAYRLDKPTARIAGKLETQQNKASDLVNQICENIEIGLFPHNAVELCEDQLGDLVGYVCDCYADLCLNYQ